MYAALKGCVIEAVIYDGNQPEVYPDWFVEDVLEGKNHMDAYGNLILLIMDGPEDTYRQIVLKPRESVVMRNRYGDIHFTDIESFGKDYWEMGLHFAALKSDCVEYFVFREGDSHWPTWFLYLIQKGLVVIGKGVTNCIFYYRGEPIMLPKMGMFIRNRYGVIKFIEKDEFEENFETPYPDYYTEMKYPERSDNYWRTK